MEILPNSILMTMDLNDTNRQDLTLAGQRTAAAGAFAARGSPDVDCAPFRYYSDLAGPEMAAKYQTPIFLIGSASAEVIADIALCPWEAVKVCAWLCARDIAPDTPVKVSDR